MLTSFFISVKRRVRFFRVQFGFLEIDFHRPETGNLPDNPKRKSRFLVHQDKYFPAQPRKGEFLPILPVPLEGMGIESNLNWT